MVNYLQNWMEAFEIDPTSLSCEIGVPEESINSFLNEKKAPLKDLFSIAYYLGTDTQTLLYSDGFEHQFLNKKNYLDLVNDKYGTDCNGLIGYICVSIVGHNEKFFFPTTKDIENVKYDLRDGYDYVVFPTLSDRIIVLNMKFVKSIELIRNPDLHPIAKDLHGRFLSTPLQPLFYEIKTFEHNSLIGIPKEFNAENLPNNIKNDYYARIREVEDLIPAQRFCDSFADYVSKTVFYYSDGSVDKKNVDYSSSGDFEDIVRYEELEKGKLIEYNDGDRKVFVNFFDTCCMIEIPLRIFEYYQRNSVF